MLAPHSPIEQFRDAVRAPPVWAGGTWRFPFGTDGDGRDMLSRLIYGARVSLFIGVAVMSVSLVDRRRARPRRGDGGLDGRRLITRVMDLIMAVPSLVLAIVVVAILGPSLANTIVAVTIVYLPRYRPAGARLRARRAQQGLRHRGEGGRRRADGGSRCRPCCRIASRR